MAILSLRQSTSEELFLAGLREIRAIIARINFRAVNCVIISERRVYRRIFPKDAIQGKMLTFNEPSELGSFRSLRCAKGPFCTKNSTALESVVFCYGHSFSHSVLFSCLFCLEKEAFLSPLRSVLLRPHRIFSPYRDSLSVAFLVREGPLGKSCD